MDEKDKTQNPAPAAPQAVETPGNAPNFTDTTLARENVRLTTELAQAQAQITNLTQRAEALEAQVDETQRNTLQAEIDALKAENQRLTTERQQQAAEQQRTARLQALDGKVRDADAALTLASQNPDLLDKDGNPDVEKIIARYSYLAPEGVTTPTTTDGAGGVQATASGTVEAALATKDVNAINAAIDAELKGASQ